MPFLGYDFSRGSHYSIYWLKFGIVERTVDLEDQRISRVYLTERGRDLIKLVGEKWKQLEDETFRGLSVEERMLLRRLLLQAFQNLARKV